MWERMSVGEIENECGRERERMSVGERVSEYGREKE